ncbi:hydroxyisourate hydrolase [Arthrobacter sp. Br18]|uniref:hydroxyisourate hydrolase n=1 Tax=Arthrobacter sp. Br18 TaxID=1312954 RepID=UPI0004789322|nr:hydroxyisourate hydrolase [Arthrobacter sp. Br18]
MTPSHVTTHVLDTGTGRPAQGITARLSLKSARGWEAIADGTTDGDGRIRNLGPDRLESGTYRIDFGTGDYFHSIGTETFFPEVTLTFVVSSPSEHYHVPLLLSPFAYSTYRGS